MGGSGGCSLEQWQVPAGKLHDKRRLTFRSATGLGTRSLESAEALSRKRGFQGVGNGTVKTMNPGSDTYLHLRYFSSLLTTLISSFFPFVESENFMGFGDQKDLTEVVRLKSGLKVSL